MTIPDPTRAAMQMAPTDDELRELAYSAHEEAMSFGLSHETFLRYFKTVRNRASLALPAEGGEPPTSSAIRDAAYDQIDRFLRNTLDDADYADYSQALDLIYTTALAATPHPPQGSAEAQSVFDELITFEETCEKRPTFADAVAIALAAKQRTSAPRGAAGEGGERGEEQIAAEALDMIQRSDMVKWDDCHDAVVERALRRAAGLRGDEAQEGGNDADR